MKKSGKENDIIKLRTPLDEETIRSLAVGDKVEIDGVIYCGRDAVLPRIAMLIEAGNMGSIGVDLKGSVIFHTAVSPAGIGPTTSNKLEIEGNIPILSKEGVKIHLGKGSLKEETATALKDYNSVFAITPPVSALFTDTIVTQRVAAFKNEGMEAFFELEVKGFPAIIAVANGKSIFGRR